MSLIQAHRVVFESRPFIVFPRYREQPIAAFRFRIDAFRFAKSETLGRPTTGETGYPWLIVESLDGKELHWFRGGERVSDPRKEVQ